jgi:hypothetical protein
MIENLPEFKNPPPPPPKVKQPTGQYREQPPKRTTTNETSGEMRETIPGDVGAFWVALVAAIACLIAIFYFLK